MCFVQTKTENGSVVVFGEKWLHAHSYGTDNNHKVEREKRSNDQLGIYSRYRFAFDIFFFSFISFSSKQCAPTNKDEEWNKSYFLSLFLSHSFPFTPEHKEIDDDERRRKNIRKLLLIKMMRRREQMRINCSNNKVGTSELWENISLCSSLGRCPNPAEQKRT